MSNYKKTNKHVLYRYLKGCKGDNPTKSLVGVSLDTSTLASRINCSTKIGLSTNVTKGRDILTVETRPNSEEEVLLGIMASELDVTGFGNMDTIMEKEGVDTYWTNVTMQGTGMSAFNNVNVDLIITEDTEVTRRQVSISGVVYSIFKVSNKGTTLAYGEYEVSFTLMFVDYHSKAETILTELVGRPITTPNLINIMELMKLTSMRMVAVYTRQNGVTLGQYAIDGSLEFSASEKTGNILVVTATSMATFRNTLKNIKVNATGLGAYTITAKDGATEVEIHIVQ